MTYNQEIKALLLSCDLPVADLQQDNRVCFFGIRHEGSLLGVIGVEVCGDFGLLRSLAIASSHRNKGLGKRLVSFAEKWAMQVELKALYLLTTEADSFFGRLGYERWPRSAAPSRITETPQFSTLCPDAAIFMHKGLGISPRSNESVQ
ncbi:arsenic resistance N-acetyltransferase ArsN2 [Ostreibacterium oceani]|nr:arsenic resistance N-acetyltransferase ArsN2 [Ostreibacterium oceani]